MEFLGQIGSSYPIVLICRTIRHKHNTYSPGNSPYLVCMYSFIFEGTTNAEYTDFQLGPYI